MSGGRDRARRFALGVLLFATIPGAWLICRLVGQAEVSVCFFRTVTGRPCPFCGLTRAFAHAVGGNPGAAFAVHPLWWLAALAVAGVGLICFLDAASGTDRLGSFLRVWRTYAWHCIVVLVIAAVLALI